jgi:hypothetical protein
LSDFPGRVSGFVLASFGYFLGNLQEFFALPLGTALFRIVLGSQQHVQARSSRLSSRPIGSLMRFARSLFWLLLLLLSCSGAAISLRVADSEVGQTAGSASDLPLRSERELSAAQQRLANSDWGDQLRSDDFWRQMRSPQSRSEAGPRRAFAPARSEAPRRASHRGEEGRSRAGNGRNQDGGSYRTVCVRLCDGYFWPVSFATSRAALEHDRRKCEQSCESPARLYAARDAETSLEDMRDDSGRYYRDLKTAFVYRSAYLESCKCRAHPWEVEAKARHAGYAQEVRPGRRQR